MKIILASASERRHELLKRITEKFDIVVSEFDEESVIFKGDCEEYVKQLAEGKASAVARLYEDAVVIGCDTIVFSQGKVLGKPCDKNEAFEMLKLLSGNVHQVYSGLSIIHMKDSKIISDFVKTDVRFSVLNDSDILAYVESGEPMDKAGAYGIQGYGGLFVEEIHGCFYNVVGLPLNRLKFLMKDMGVSLENSVKELCYEKYTENHGFTNQ
jgi:septum formation protein